MLFMTAPLAVAVTSGHAWDVIEIDSETHTGNTNPIEGIYMDKGAWKWREWPDCHHGGYRFLTVELDPNRHGIAFFLVQIPKTGFYKLETSYFDTHNRTNDADYAVYVNATTAEAENQTVKPVYAVSISQVGPGEIPWRDMGTYCLQKTTSPCLSWITWMIASQLQLILVDGPLWEKNTTHKVARVG